jgi:hypothetical protein
MSEAQKEISEPARNDVLPEPSRQTARDESAPAAEPKRLL